ncbi:acyl-CoA dehydrogenase [Streptomyces sp. DSM 44915]|uniref:Acyl-CoA dehydrogenase n=1 Tax=Streptomyces chisholmiae TaxID=3075540 RepID=A0ABU2JZ87_9ACTN|nr:acyl-CoA dehydrogenase [Streptomyces sp. DSM 44915]MDT0270054.1 acyl-CoA dehydrogenase [Streptomyces sp. DSM 44915]
MTVSQLPVKSDPLTTSSALRELLFEAREEVHEPWRRLFSSSAFAYQEGLTHRERTELSYRRLRLVNAAMADPRAVVGDAEALSALHEWAGVADSGLTTILSIHYNLFLGSLLEHDHADRDLGPYLRMDRVGTFLCTEQAHGNDAPQLQTTATLDRATGTLVLDTPDPGARKWMPNTSGIGGPKDAVVAARLLIDNADHGVFLFLTPLTDASGQHLPGIEVRHLPQTASSPMDHCATSFHGVRLPLTAMLQGDHGRLSPDGRFSSALGSSRKRFLRSIGRVTAGKLCMSGYSLGAMRHALTVAVRHAHQRVTSGMTSGQRVPLFAHRSHHAPLVEALATVYAASLLHRAVTRGWTRATPENREDAERLVAIAKGWTTWQARQVMTECRERCGAQGLLLSNGIAGQLAANEGSITAEGDNTVIWVKAAGEMLLGGFTPRPASDVAPASRSLLDPGHLLDLLADLERVRHGRARTRLRTRGAGSPLERWNGASGPALALVDAHAHRLAAQEVLAAAERAADPKAAGLLTDLHRLFALRYVTAHSGELLAHERLTSEQVRQLPETVEAVVAALIPEALTLTDAFDTLDELTDRHPMLRTAVSVL